MQHHERERVISVSLTEAEWQAFIARHPSPVDWLRARILEEVGRPALDASRDPKQVVYEAQLSMRTSPLVAE
jgi:hypothetical protein